jgi:hypothetical protein
VVAIAVRRESSGTLRPTHQHQAVEIAGDVRFRAAAGAQAYACTSSTWGKGKRADSVISAAVLHDINLVGELVTVGDCQALEAQ